MKHALGIAVVATLVSAAASAVAADAARADALFKQGRAALEQGQVARACKLLQASFDEDPTAIGTLLNLAYCHQAQGRLWQAYREYGDAERMATNRDRKEFAARSRTEVARKLPHVKLDVGDQIVTEVVIDDGTRIDDPTQPFPVDPGPRTITLRGPTLKKTLSLEAPNRAGVVAVIVVPSEGSARTETVDSPAVGQAGAAPPAPPETPRDAPSQGGEPAPESRASLAPYAFVLGGVAVAGIALGTYFGLKSLSIRDSACPSKECDPAGLERIHGSATTTATLSTVSFAVGAVSAVGTVVLFTIDRSRANAALRVRTTAQGAGITLDVPY